MGFWIPSRSRDSFEPVKSCQIQASLALPRRTQCLVCFRPRGEACALTRLHTPSWPKWWAQWYSACMGLQQRFQVQHGRCADNRSISSSSKILWTVDSAPFLMIRKQLHWCGTVMLPNMRNKLMQMHALSIIEFILAHLPCALPRSQTSHLQYLQAFCQYRRYGIVHTS